MDFKKKNSGVLLIVDILVKPEMGTCSKFCVPALLCSWHFRNAGMWKSKFYTGMREHGTRKDRNAKFALLWRSIEHLVEQTILCVVL